MSVKIGTSLSQRAKKVQLCGSGELGKKVAIELQRLGVEVIAVDRYENAPAMQASQKMAEQVTTALGGKGLFGVELFIKDDEVIFSEVSPRPHDTSLVTLVSQVGA